MGHLLIFQCLGIVLRVTSAAQGGRIKRGQPRSYIRTLPGCRTYGPVASSRELVALRHPGTKDTSDASCAHITRSVCPCHMIQFTRSCSGWTHQMLGLPTSSRPAKRRHSSKTLDETVPQSPDKLNPEKCVFGVPAGKLLSFLVSHYGIEANPKKIRPRAATSMPLSSNKSPARTTWLPMSSPGSPPQGNPHKAVRSGRSFTNPPPGSPNRVLKSPHQMRTARAGPRRPTARSSTCQGDNGLGSKPKPYQTIFIKYIYINHSKPIYTR